MRGPSNGQRCSAGRRVAPKLPGVQSNFCATSQSSSINNNIDGPPFVGILVWRGLLRQEHGLGRRHELEHAKQSETDT